MASGPIEAVLFDYGGVFTVSPFSSADALANRLGITREAMLGRIFGPYDDDTDHPWHRVERGEITLEAARQAILDGGAPGDPPLDIWEFFAAIGQAGPGVIEPMVDCVRAVRAHGAKTAIVTNNVRELGEHWRNTLPLSELFDAIIDSSEVGMRKPDPRIYRRALEAVGGVTPERAAFLDDFPGNIDAARRLGLTGILVEDDVSGAISELKQLLGIR